MKANSVVERSRRYNEERLRAEGKFFKPPEDLAFFRWLIRKIHNDMVENVKKNGDDSNGGTWICGVIRYVKFCFE